ncbi:MAG: hypothetical protein ACRDRR_08965 [Pseudonocardiaceae bacterium]
MSTLSYAVRDSQTMLRRNLRAQRVAAVCRSCPQVPAGACPDRVDQR